jgi:hypothetical protein
LKPLSLAHSYPSVTTDPRTGAFEIKPIFAGAYRLRISAPGFAEPRLMPFDVAKDEHVHVGDIALQHAGTLRVKLVRAGGGPIGNVSLWLSGDGGDPKALAIFGDQALSSELAPGLYDAIVRAEDGQSLGRPQQFEITGGKATQLEIELPRAPSSAPPR